VFHNEFTLPGNILHGTGHSAEAKSARKTLVIKVLRQLRRLPAKLEAQACKKIHSSIDIFFASLQVYGTEGLQSLEDVESCTGECAIVRVGAWKKEHEDFQGYTAFPQALKRQSVLSILAARLEVAPFPRHWNGPEVAPLQKHSNAAFPRPCEVN
jgi:hypothetical protein